MTNTPTDTGGNVVVKSPTGRGPSVPVALTIAAVAGAIAIVATIIDIRNDFSTIVEALLAALCLIAFGVTAYGLIQTVLAIVDGAGERRLRDREITERRLGDRARKPKGT